MGPSNPALSPPCSPSPFDWSKAIESYDPNETYALHDRDADDSFN